MRIHTGERPFKCNFKGCDAAFAHSSSLKAHKRRRHTGERPYKCDVEGCDAAFAASSNLVTHKRRHIGEKPYKCDVEGCDAAFAACGHLVVHKRIHTGERPYKCDVDGCREAFAHSSALKKHKRRRHTGERPFECDFDGCGAAFADSGSLMRHKESTHTTAGIQRKKKQEQAMQNALVLADYVQSFERGRVPNPGEFTREVYFDHRCALASELGDFMPGEMKYAYVDFVVNTRDGRLVFLEVDEEQHAHREQLCETTRMWNICESIALADLGADVNVFWLRVNPNVGFHVAGKTLRTPREQRFAEVIKFLDALKSSPHDPPMQIGYAFYDCGANGEPLVLKESDYHPDVAKAVVCISKGSQQLVQPCKFSRVKRPLFEPAEPAEPADYDTERCIICADDSSDDDGVGLPASHVGTEKKKIF